MLDKIKELLLPLFANKLFLVILLFLMGYLTHAFLGKDNPLEQTTEAILKNNYNIDYDFSKEKGQ